MQIILVPDSDGKKGHHTCLTPQFVLGLVLALSLVVPLAVGAGAYKITQELGAVKARHQRDMRDQVDSDSDGVAYWGGFIQEQMLKIDETRRVADSHFDALGLRVGALQAQIMRINALGERLTALAGLDGAEFNFGQPPPVGGPATLDQLSELDHPDVVQSLSDLSIQAEASRAQLEVLLTLLMERDFEKKNEPAGWPAEGGWISSSYGHRRDPFTGRKAFHRGVDIANKPDAAITAIAAGIVTTVKKDPGYGLMVDVNHGNGYVTRYAHLMEANVKVGDRVTKGGTIGIVGSSGRSTGTHLHFEVRRDGKHLNPQEYLKTAS